MTKRWENAIPNGQHRQMRTG